MAIRLYSQEQFEEQIKELWGLEPTDARTETGRLWKTPDGFSILVPVLPNGVLYPHYLIGEIANQIPDALKATDEL